MDNVNELLNPVIIPNINMTIEEKINTIVRAVLFVGIICTLVLNDTRYILFIIIIMIASILIINYQYEKNSKIEKFLNSNNIDIIDNKKCIKPTESNPFMNPNILNLTDENKNLKACSIDNMKVDKQKKDLFYKKVFRNSKDIYNRTSSERQFYTVPSTTIPNERDKLGKWLYDRGRSCKEGNGNRCYTNLYNNIKNNVHI